MYRKFCCCVCGPKGKGMGIGIATAFFMVVFGLTALLIMSQYVDNFYIFIQLGLTAATQFMLLYVACRDPGFIDPQSYDSSKVNRLTRTHNDINDEETVFSEAHIYEPRYCETCKINRPPLSSHCKYCNACVIKYDHHCTVVNICIGARNHRGFVLTLFFAWLQFLYLMLFCAGEILYNQIYLNILHLQRNDSEFSREEITLQIVLCSIIEFLVLVKLLSFYCCGSSISYGRQVIWIFLEIIIVQILCLINISNWYLNIVGFLYCIGSSGFYLVWGTLHRQMQLAALGLTLKEASSRRAQMESEYERDPRLNITCGQKCGNFMSFWCCNPIPKS